MLEKEKRPKLLKNAGDAETPYQKKIEKHVLDEWGCRVHITSLKKSHVSQFLVDLSVQEGSLVARERGLQAVFDENADYRDTISKL